MPKSFLNIAGYPFGLRNNNPGNLRATGDQWRGMIGTNNGFVVFENIGYGIRALTIDISGDINEGKNTIEKLISEFAPSSENDTRAYINSVVQSTGIPWNQILSVNAVTLEKLIRGIMNVELGSNYSALITSADIKEGISMADANIPVGEIGFSVASLLFLVALGLLATMPKASKS